jgi:uncharacterized protein
LDHLEFLFLGVVGIIGGALSGLVGVGGGVVFVPGLLFAGGWTIQEAVAASLVIMVFGALSGTIRNARSSDPVNWRVAGLLSLAVAPSSLIGVLIGRVSPDAATMATGTSLSPWSFSQGFSSGRSRGSWGSAAGW